MVWKLAGSLESGGADRHSEIRLSGGTFHHIYPARPGRPALDLQQKLLRNADVRTATPNGQVPMENKRGANGQLVRNILSR